jgi:Xaa-Pro aminopeptidase
MTLYDERRVALMKEVDADAFLVANLEGSDAATLRYLTGFTGEGALLVTREGGLLLTDSRYTEQAGREVPRLPVGPVTGEYPQAVAAALKERSLKRVAFASRRLSHYWVLRLRGRRAFRLVALEDPVMALRSIKGEAEIEKIRRAASVAEAALADLFETIRIGMTERKIALDLEWRMRERGAEGPAFELIVAAGENSALPHYRPGERKIAEADLLLFDIGAQVDGYCSDLTRVVAVGRVPARAKELYDLVLRANRAGVEAVAPGASARDVDAAARAVIADAGHGDRFGHGLGHGVGLEVHEGPHVSPRSDETLQVGMVTTIEPGVYLPGFGGVRIEDLVAVRKGGRELLTRFPSETLVKVG